MLSQRCILLSTVRSERCKNRDNNSALFYKNRGFCKIERRSVGLTYTPGLGSCFTPERLRCQRLLPDPASYSPPNNLFVAGTLPHHNVNTDTQREGEYTQAKDQAGKEAHRRRGRLVVRTRSASLCSTIGTRECIALTINA